MINISWKQLSRLFACKVIEPAPTQTSSKARCSSFALVALNRFDDLNLLLLTLSTANHHLIYWVYRIWFAVLSWVMIVVMSHESSIPDRVQNDRPIPRSRQRLPRRSVTNSFAIRLAVLLAEWVIVVTSSDLDLDSQTVDGCRRIIFNLSVKL